MIPDEPAHIISEFLHRSMYPKDKREFFVAWGEFALEIKSHLPPDLWPDDITGASAQVDRFFDDPKNHRTSQNKPHKG